MNIQEDKKIPEDLDILEKEYLTILKKIVIIKKETETEHNLQGMEEMYQIEELIEDIAERFTEIGRTKPLLNLAALLENATGKLME